MDQLGQRLWIVFSPCPQHSLQLLEKSLDFEEQCGDVHNLAENGHVDGYLDREVERVVSRF